MGEQTEAYDGGLGEVPGIVRRIRRTADLAQRDLAREANVSQSTVARWETGEASPRADLLVELARLAVHYRQRGWRRTVDRMLHGQPAEHPTNDEPVAPPLSQSHPEVQDRSDDGAHD